ncbi:MAG: beta-galactosidase, partial [Armatimonadota bacterium]|nr:beta-galactosidase [Armatimonadota bacterium]
PWCIGYFVDNELSWGGWGDDGGRYGLARGALIAPAGSPAKAAFLAQLRAKYGTIQALNAAWGTRIPSWDTLEQPYEPARPLNAAMKADMGAFVKALALKYFTVVRNTLRQFDANHLYLGCRFAWRTPEAVEAAAEVCDVVSFNIYQRRVDPGAWEFTKALRKPCIIGEFHFGALDRGMFHTGLVATANQEERARAYQEYVRSVVDHPAFVGCHWFQYKDQPLTGRTLDGENYNIGFVSGTDTPYPEMVAAARAVHAEVYGRRAGR